MSYYTNRRYAPPAAVYAASTLIGPHTGPCARPDVRTCANCANSADNNPARCLCGLCTGATAPASRWEPLANKPNPA